MKKLTARQKRENDKRVHNAIRALQAYDAGVDQTAAQDLITDLLHFIWQQSDNRTRNEELIDACIRMARANFEAEINGKDC